MQIGEQDQFSFTTKEPEANWCVAFVANQFLSPRIASMWMECINFRLKQDHISLMWFRKLPFCWSGNLHGEEDKRKTITVASSLGKWSGRQLYYALVDANMYLFVSTEWGPDSDLEKAEASLLTFKEPHPLTPGHNLALYMTYFRILQLSSIIAYWWNH